MYLYYIDELIEFVDFIFYYIIIQAFQQKIQQYSIKSYTNFAEQFQNNYKFKFEKQGTTKQAQIQNQFWRLVKGPQTDDVKIRQKYKLKVEYAADLPASKYGSGFPTSDSFKSRDENFNYATSFYNLNNIYKCPTSLFGMVNNKNQHISGVTVPWIYMGMLFSTFCWHVQDLWLNSINYNHKGAIKTWYVIPQDNKEKFDAYVLKKTSNIDILKGINFIIDPIQLIQNGVKVFKAYQRPRQYILTLFNAYHCGFSQGFNIGQAVNVCHVDSLAIMKKAYTFNKLFRKNHKAPVICYDWLICKNIHNKSINAELIKKQYEKLTSLQYETLKSLINKLQITKIQIIKEEYKYDKISCNSCKYYQYVSALKCNCCEKKYCFQHADKCCGKGLTFLSRVTDKQRDKSIKMIEEFIKK